MCQSGNVLRKIAVIFMLDAKIICDYSFVVYLKIWNMAWEII